VKVIGLPKTVGELRTLIAKLPDDMPLHHRGNVGDHPVGLMLVIRTLAPASNEPSYFADIETDVVWSKPERRDSFGEAVEALCST
jgi:hypothetical protein